jgi:ferredoxin, 2Fe-2S
MPKVTFIAHDGTRHDVAVAPGTSLMLAAVDNRVPGIDGDCGGQCACATCHVFIESPWTERLAPPDPREHEMLDFTAERRETSRLACRIPVTDALDGLTVSMPDGQH